MSNIIYLHQGRGFEPENTLYATFLHRFSTQIPQPAKSCTFIRWYPSQFKAIIDKICRQAHPICLKLPILFTKISAFKNKKLKWNVYGETCVFMRVIKIEIHDFCSKCVKAISWTGDTYVKIVDCLAYNKSQMFLPWYQFSCIFWVFYCSTSSID